LPPHARVQPLDSRTASKTIRIEDGGLSG
jgi:hypothetical protein